MGGKTNIRHIRRLLVLFVLCPLNIPVQADHDDSSSGMGELCGWRANGQEAPFPRWRRICSTGVQNADREILFRVSPWIQRSAVHSNIQS